MTVDVGTRLDTVGLVHQGTALGRGVDKLWRGGENWCVIEGAGNAGMLGALEI